MQPAQLLYSMQDSATRIGVSRSGMYNIAAAGEVTLVRIGGRRLVTAESLESYVERLKAEAVAEVEVVRQ